MERCRSVELRTSLVPALQRAGLKPGLYKIRRHALGPGEAVFGEREGADALAGDGEDGVADGGENGRESGFAEAGGGVVGLQEMDFDFRGDLVHADRGIFVEVALDGAAAVDGDLVGHDVAQAFDDRAADLVFGAAGIDDLAADVASYPNFIYFYFAVGVDAEFDDFGEVSTVSELEGDAHGGVFGQLAGAPAGFFGDEFEDAAHAGGVEIGFRRIGRGRCGRNAGRVEEIQTELDGIFSGGVRQLVGEGLEDPREGVAARGAHGVGGNAERHERRAKEKVWQESSGEFVARNVGGGSELLAFAEADEVIAPSDEFAGGIEAALEEMKAGGA